MANKKIVNTSNNRAYKITERTTKHGVKGQIMGLYKAKKNASIYVKKNLGDVIKKLSSE